ncbi:MAG: hypothetical protein AAF846_15360 [Chloroflexota bacterium]
MEAFLIFGIGLFALIFLGIIFALPVEIPPIRRYAQTSKTTQYTTIATFGFITLTITIGLLACVYVIMLNGFTGLTYPKGYFYPNMMLNSALDRELWFHLMLPPFHIITNMCFSQFEEVCVAKDELLIHDIALWFNYVVRLCIAIIPTISCMIRVHQITYIQQKPIDTWIDDPRKKKKHSS